MKKISLKQGVVALIVIVLFLQFFGIINSYIYLSSIANTYINQSPLWLGFAIGLLMPLGFVSVYIISLNLIIKNKIQGYKYIGLASLAMIVQLMGPVFEGKKGFLDVSVILWPVIILGILSFLAYSKLKTEQFPVEIKKKKMFNSFFVIMLIVLFAVSLTINQKDKHNDFPPKNIECFDRFLGVTNYPNYSEMAPFELSKLTHFKCSSWTGYYQFEIEGIDKENHSFYLYRQGGGTAASGADSRSVVCYKKDGLIIKNDAFYGRDWVKKEGFCKWDTNLDNYMLQNSTDTNSKYEYFK